MFELRGVTHLAKFSHVKAFCTHLVYCAHKSAFPWLAMRTIRRSLLENSFLSTDGCLASGRNVCFRGLLPTLVRRMNQLVSGTRLIPFRFVVHMASFASLERGKACLARRSWNVGKMATVYGGVCYPPCRSLERGYAWVGGLPFAT